MARRLAIPCFFGVLLPTGHSNSLWVSILNARVKFITLFQAHKNEAWYVITRLDSKTTRHLRKIDPGEIITDVNCRK